MLPQVKNLNQFRRLPQLVDPSHETVKPNQIQPRHESKLINLVNPDVHMIIQENSDPIWQKTERYLKENPAYDRFKEEARRDEALEDGINMRLNNLKFGIRPQRNNEELDFNLDKLRYIRENMKEKLSKLVPDKHNSHYKDRLKYRID